MVKATPIKHGTSSGYTRHVKHPEKYGPPCGPCTKANTEAQRLRRAGSANERDRYNDFRTTKIRRRALSALAERHPRDYALLLQEAELALVNEEIASKKETAS